MKEWRSLGEVKGRLLQAGGMSRSEEAGVSEEAVRRKGARRSEKAKVPEEG